MFLHKKLCRQRGVTLLELMTVFLIITILGFMIVPVVGEVKKRVSRTRCMANMRNIHIATKLYLQDYRTWPKVPSPRYAEQTEIAKQWIGLMKPYGLEQNVWICPVIQVTAGSPDLSKPENMRIDYIAGTFVPGPEAPYRWTTQPWYIESANAHGNGNLIVFSDGHIQDAFDVIRNAPKK